MNNTDNNYTKWVAMWGNAMSIADHKPAMYAKDLTLRYPIYCPFSGNKIRISLDNYCGTETVSVEKCTILKKETFTDVTFEEGKDSAIMEAGKTIVSDEIDIDICQGDTIYISLYFKDYTQMRSSVVAMGPLSKGQYSLGDNTKVKDIPIGIARGTDVFYFLSSISILTEEKNRAIVCYGDSITAQDWPDYLTLLLKEEGIDNVSIIRRATSGSRILREYDNITYESYGLKGTNRFEHEVPTDGADTVIIQQGINDIIHPVGVDVNPFRPMSDLPTVDELINGMKWYIEKAKEYGYRVYIGTLLPIEGWRTYADFREDMKNQFNDWIRSTELIDGCIDFDKALRDPANVKKFVEAFDSGDHLHPSAKGYEAMAKTALNIFK